MAEKPQRQVMTGAGVAHFAHECEAGPKAHSTTWSPGYPAVEPPTCPDCGRPFDLAAEGGYDQRASAEEFAQLEEKDRAQAREDRINAAVSARLEADDEAAEVERRYQARLAEPGPAVGP